MKSLTNYITESASKQTFDAMLKELIDSDAEKLIIANTANKADSITIEQGDFDFFIYACFNCDANNNQQFFKVKEDDKMFKDGTYRTQLADKIKKSKYAPRFKNFINDLENNTTKACEIISKASYEEGRY